MDTQRAATFVSEIVGEAGEILGSRLAKVLVERYPGWSTDASHRANLRSFIEQYVPSVVPCGRSGMDYVYRLANSGTINAGAANPDLWRAWVSPNGRYELTVELTTGTVRAVPRSAPTPSNHVRLSSPSVSAHQEVAREFLREVAVDRDDKLSRLIVADNSNWWQAWYGALQKEGLALEWNAFRRKKLEEALRVELERVRLAPACCKAAEATIRSADQQGKTIRSMTMPKNRASDSVAVMRALAIYAVERMDEDELRSLRLPLGIVLDSVREGG